ncbi:MAG: hybrid sensor histidine kinase/response regulator, partial [Gammaproteobacteria bacterium]|nr:hybrid sensor histidine kinase/response regulator [Gammaproteobacteria bacterium]
MDNHDNSTTVAEKDGLHLQGLRVQAELVRLLYQQTRTVLLGLLATASIVAIIFYNNVPNQYIVAWLVVVYGLTLVRYLFSRKFKAKQRGSAETIKWGWQFTFFAFLSGCTWGAASLIFYTPDNIQLFIILTLIIIGLTITSMAALSAVLWAYYAYAVPAMIPIVWRYMSMDDHAYSVFGVLILILILTLFPFARVNHRTLKQSILLRFENVELVEQLTEQKEKSEHARRVAEEANVAKTKFLAAASHDLRQPLHAIGLFLGALESRVDRDDQKTIVQKIQNSSQALSGLLDSLLDISKLDAGVIHVQPKLFYVQNLFDELEYEFEPYAAEKNLTLRFVRTKLCLFADYAILNRIIRNLVSNAIRYTNKGGVVVGCRRKEGKVILAVYDTGIGIKDNQMEEIFNEFHQLHNPERDRSKGLGLGLAIVKRMAELLEAPLITKSTPGQGSMFGIGMLRESSVGEIDNISHETDAALFFDTKNVLIVDDEKEILDSLSVLLESWRCKVIAASSSEEAVHLL